MDKWREAIKLLDTAGCVAVLLGSEPSWDAFAAGAALCRALKARGKEVGVFAGPADPPLPNFIAREIAGSDREPPRDFIISFDLERSPIKELRYERGENRLDIILSPQSARISQEEVRFGYGPVRYDLVLTLGVPEIRAIEPVIEDVPELLHEKTVLNIDYRASNTSYGDINLIESRASSLCQVLWLMLKAWDDFRPDSELATLLLFGLSSVQPHIPLIPSAAEMVRCVHELLESGANTAILALNAGTEKNSGRVQLLGRALARSRFDAQRGFLLTVITREDFSAAGQSHRSVYFVSQGLERLFPEIETRLILWQHPASQTVYVEVGSGAKVAADKIDSFKKGFNSLAQAEDVIRATLAAKPDLNQEAEAGKDRL